MKTRYWLSLLKPIRVVAGCFLSVTPPVTQLVLSHVSSAAGLPAGVVPQTHNGSVLISVLASPASGWHRPAPSCGSSLHSRPRRTWSCAGRPSPRSTTWASTCGEAKRAGRSRLPAGEQPLDSQPGHRCERRTLRVCGPRRAGRPWYYKLETIAWAGQTDGWHGPVSVQVGEVGGRQIYLPLLKR